MKNFIGHLRLYNAGNVANLGGQLLWRLYKGEKVELSPESCRIVRQVGPRVISFALGSATPYGSWLLTPSVFVDLCKRLLEIDHETSTPPFLEMSAMDLKARVLAKGQIPERFLTDSSIRATGLPIIMSRLGTSQFRSASDDTNDFVRAWSIMSAMDRRSHGLFGDRVAKLFNVKLLDLWRAAFMAFAMAQDSHGAFRCNVPTDQEIIDDWHMDMTVVDAAASKLAISLSDVRAWFAKVMTDTPPVLRPYVDDPLSDHGLLIDDSRPPHSYLVPAPALFVRAAHSKIIGTVADNFPPERNGVNNTNTLYGEEFEAHVEVALRAAFEERLVRPQSVTASKSADFILKLDGIAVVLELKKQLASRHARSMMGPSEISQIFHETFDALEQIAATAATLRSTNNPVSGIIVVSEDTAIEAVPLLMFAKHSGMLGEMGLANVDVISWPDLEARIAQSSLSSFTNMIRTRQADGNRTSFLLQTANWKRDHSMLSNGTDYLDSARNELMGRFA